MSDCLETILGHAHPSCPQMTSPRQGRPEALTQYFDTSLTTGHMSIFHLPVRAFTIQGHLGCIQDKYDGSASHGRSSPNPMPCTCSSFYLVPQHIIYFFFSWPTQTNKQTQNFYDLSNKTKKERKNKEIRKKKHLERREADHSSFIDIYRYILKTSKNTTHMCVCMCVCTPVLGECWCYLWTQKM